MTDKYEKNEDKNLEKIEEKSEEKNVITHDPSAERRARRKRRQRRRRYVLAILVVLAAVGVIVTYMMTMYTSVYSNEDEFQDFAAQQFNKTHVLPDAKDRLITFEYSEDVSFAFRYDPSFNEDLAVFRDQQVEWMKDEFLESAKKAEKKRKASAENDFFYRGLHRAMLFDSAVYDSGTGALTMAIYAVEYREKDKKMVPYRTDIHTYLLGEETLNVLNPLQVMKAEYKEKLAKYTQEYLKKAYSKDQFKSDAQDYLGEDFLNYNQFVISQSGVTVFFDEGTILEKSAGTVSVTVPKIYMGNTIRNKIIDRYIDPDKPMVAITYDDGPGGEAEKRILKCLKKYNVVATFFYLGNRIEYDKENVRKAFSQGCEIANHSWDHPDMTGLSAKQVKKQLKKTNNAIARVTGVTPVLYRPPYGSYNESVLKAAGMPAILWTVDTLDWSSKDAKAVYKKVKSVKKLDGKIILMHSLYDSTAKATEKIVPYLQKKGYQLVTVSELIKYKTGKAPKKGKVYISGKEYY